MIKCPQCGMPVEDDVDFCYHCGEILKETPEESSEDTNTDMKNENEISDSVDKEHRSDEENHMDDSSSTVGGLIKVLAIIVLILSVIGSFVLMDSMGVAIGVISLIISVLTSLLAYGIGEIVCILKEINSKLG